MRDPDEPRQPYDLAPESASAPTHPAPTPPPAPSDVATEAGRLPVARLAPDPAPSNPAALGIPSPATFSPTGSTPSPASTIPTEPGAFVRTGFGDAKAVAIAGGVLTIAAVFATAITASGSEVAASFLTLYAILVHAGTGVVAILLAAALADRKAGDLALAGARMLAAVAAGVLVFHLNITLFSTSKTEEVILGGAVYALAVLVLFRLWGPRTREFTTLLALHFALWLIIRIGMELAVWAQPMAKAAAAVAPVGPTP